MVSLVLYTNELRSRVLTRDFPRPDTSVDRAALCLTVQSDEGAVVLFIGDNRIDWDDEDEPWRMSDRVKLGFNIETLVGASVEIVNIGPAVIPKADRDGACASRAEVDVFATKVVTADDVDVVGEPIISTPALIALPTGLTMDQVEVIGGLIFRRQPQ